MPLFVFLSVSFVHLPTAGFRGMNTLVSGSTSTVGLGGHWGFVVDDDSNRNENVTVRFPESMPAWHDLISSAAFVVQRTAADVCM